MNRLVAAAVKAVIRNQRNKAVAAVTTRTAKKQKKTRLNILKTAAVATGNSVMAQRDYNTERL